MLIFLTAIRLGSCTSELQLKVNCRIKQLADQPNFFPTIQVLIVYFDVCILNSLVHDSALSEYDQVLLEDEETNRLRESVRLFETILTTPWFEDKDVILFLNKTDLLKAKIQRGKSPVSNYFPEYEGPDDDYEAVVEFFTVSLSCSSIIRRNHYEFSVPL